MSFLSWFTLRPRAGSGASKAHPAGARPTGLVSGHITKPANPVDALARKNIRMERRESLYMVVRDTMMRAGVLSAGYKFKVLSLDQHGQQFVVMIDLAREYGTSTNRLSEIEGLITGNAKARFEIIVTAVYWRLHDNTAVGLRMRRAAESESAPVLGPGAPQTLRAPIMPPGSYEARNSGPVPLRNSGAMPLNSGRVPLDSRPDTLHSGPAPLTGAAATSARVPLVTAPAPLPAAPPAGPLLPPNSRSGPYDPIEDDEVAAFKRALNTAANSAGTRTALASERPGTTVRSGPMTRSPLLQPSGFSDTLMPGSDAPSSDLSSTQYGDLH